MTAQELLTNIVNQIRTGIPNNVKSSNLRALLTGITQRISVVEPGRLTWFKASGNTSIDPEAGDLATGIIENTFVVNAKYLGGDISLLSSYSISEIRDYTISSLPFQLIKNKTIPNDLPSLETGDIIKGFTPNGDYIEAKFLGGDVTDFENENVYTIFNGI